MANMFKTSDTFKALIQALTVTLGIETLVDLADAFYSTEDDREGFGNFENGVSLGIAAAGRDIWSFESETGIVLFFIGTEDEIAKRLTDRVQFLTDESDHAWLGMEPGWYVSLDDQFGSTEGPFETEAEARERLAELETTSIHEYLAGN